MEPRVEPVGIPESGKVAPRADQRLLHRVLREVLVAQDRVRPAVEPPDRTTREQREALMVTLAGPLHAGPLVDRARVCREHSRFGEGYQRHRLVHQGSASNGSASSREATLAWPSAFRWT